MSVAILGDDAYNTIYTALLKAKSPAKSSAHPDWVFRAWCIEQDKRSAKEIAMAWMKANYARYNDRYGEDDIQLSEMTDLRTVKKIEPVQLYKYLQALLYNMDSDDQKKEYDEVSKYLAAIADNIIMRMPEYEGANWFQEGGVLNVDWSIFNLLDV